MDLPIEIFDVMADIAKENRIRSVKWAAASGLSPSRISDFKKLAQKTKAGAAGPDQEHDVSRRTFSPNTFLTLWDGLKRLAGATTLRRGLMRQLETKKVSTRVRIFLRLMTCTDAQLKLVDVFTDALLHRINTISNRDKR
jgi:hypothetical protein